MSRVTTSNYTADADTSFQYATDDNDAFDRNDVSYLARALERHSHAPGRGVQLTGDGFADNTITTAKLAAGAVATAKIADAAVTAIKMAVDSVATANIVNLAVTTAKLADLSVTGPKIALAAIDASHLATNSVGADEIVAGGVGTAEIVDGAIINSKMADNNLNLGTKGLDLSLTGGKIAATTINGDQKIIPGTITGNAGTSAIPIDSIHANRISASLTQAELLRWSGSGQFITATSIVDGTITAAKLASGVAAVPSGLIAAFPTAAQIPAGWARYSSLDGRVPVGAGTTFGVTYTENTASGSSWSHQHTGPSHTHGAAALGIAGNTGGPSGTNTTGSTGNTSADGSHTHGVGSMDVTGTTDADGTGNTGNTAWLIPNYTIVFAQKS